MRALAVVSGAGATGVARRDPDRVARFVRWLGELGAVDLVVVHDEGSTEAARREAVDLVAPEGGVDRRLAVVTAPPRRAGLLREVHLHQSDADEVAARATPAFQAVDRFLTSAPAPHDVAWCSDLVSLTRAGWLRRSLATAVDVDRHEDLSSTRLVRAARRTATTAHLVTVPDDARRDELAVPGSLVVAGGDVERFLDALRAVAATAAAYQPVRSTVSTWVGR